MLCLPNHTQYFVQELKLVSFCNSTSKYVLFYLKEMAHNHPMWNAIMCHLYGQPLLGQHPARKEGLDGAPTTVVDRLYEGAPVY